MSLDYFSDQTLESVPSEGIVKGEYENCIFKGLTLLDHDLKECKFLDSEFVDCDISNADISKAFFQNVHFNNCKLLGLRFEECNSFLFGAKFNNCQMDHCAFYQMDLTRCDFNRSRLHSVDFGEADLTEVKLTECDLHEAMFERTNLERADLRNAVNYTIDPEGNQVKGAKFTLAEVPGLLRRYNIIVEL